MSNIVIELSILATVVVAIQNLKSQQQSNPVVIPVRTDETVRRH
ncbi:MAG: hypothetical protein AAGF26_02105 [Cyanobacteria bacterium P01_G01_bin.49]